jgi:hypothetical protein
MATASEKYNPTKAGLFNNYTITPRNLTQYTAFRGVTDFTQLGQFAPYEKGYQFLSVISLPKYMTKLGEINKTIDAMNQSFQHTLEYEFRGMDGLPDITSDTYTISDGINEMNLIGKVSMDTSIQISMSYFEKSGSLLEKYSEYYLTGLRDLKTQAKTYHGLIANGTLAPGLENEVFTLLYYATDSTMLRLERAVLLANCQLTQAEQSMYNGNRQDIGSIQETTITFNAFPITGIEVDKAASVLLKDITGVGVTMEEGKVPIYTPDNSIKTTASLDSNDYIYGIMGNPDGSDVDTENNTVVNSTLYNARRAANANNAR